MSEVIDRSPFRDDGAAARGWAEMPFIARMLITLATAWVLTGIILGGFSTFQFLDPFRVGRMILDGLIPYRDFPLEYPPGGAAVLTAPALFGASAYEAVFRALMAAAWGAMALLVWRWDRPQFAAFLIASVSLAWVIGGGFDITVALAVYLGFRWTRRERSVASAGALGVGIAIKLTPGVLLPFVLRAAPRRRLVTAAATAAASIVIAVVVPFVIARGDGDPIRFHGDRALHAESTVGSVIVLGRIASDQPYPVVVEDNARAVADAGDGPVRISLALLGVALIVVWLRGRPTHPAAWTAALLAIPAIGPLASPQFLLWPLGLIGSTSRRTLAAFVVAGILSGVMFSGPFEPSEGTGLALLTAIRNLTLLAAFGLATAEALAARGTPSARRHD